MKRLSSKLFLLIVALIALAVGTGADSYLRSRVGRTCYGCNTLECKIVTIADNPKVFFEHPVEIIKDILSTEY